MRKMGNHVSTLKYPESPHFPAETRPLQGVPCNDRYQITSCCLLPRCVWPINNTLPQLISNTGCIWTSQGESDTCSLPLKLLVCQAHNLKEKAPTSTFLVGKGWRLNPTAVSQNSLPSSNNSQFNIHKVGRGLRIL